MSLSCSCFDHNLQLLIFLILVIVLVDISNVWGRQKLPDDVLRLLYLHESKTTLLVLNKVRNGL